MILGNLSFYFYSEFKYCQSFERKVTSKWFLALSILGNIGLVKELLIIVLADFVAVE